MVSQPWLALSAPAPGFQGSYLLESPRKCPINDASPILLCVGNVGKHSFFQGTGLADCNQEENTVTLHDWYHYVIADCYLTCTPVLRKMRGGPLPAEAQLHHLMQGDPERVLARLVRPLASCILLFADDFGGLRRAASMLARWVLFSMRDSIPYPPHLFVVHHSGSADSRSFCRRTDAELLMLLRRASPERPYAAAKVSDIRRRCFDSMEVIARDAVLDTVSERFEAERVLHMRSVESTVAFRLLATHLCAHPALEFDMLEALNAREPMPPCSDVYIKRFLKTTAEAMVDPIPFLALCLASESTLCLVRSKYGETYTSYERAGVAGLIPHNEAFQPIKYSANGTCRYWSASNSIRETDTRNWWLGSGRNIAASLDEPR